MRDPKRIDTMLQVLEYYWKQNPDMRLGQLIGNIARDPELYYMEDDKLMRRIIGTYECLNGDREETRAMIKAWTGEDVKFADEVEGAAAAGDTREDTGGDSDEN